MPDKKKVSAIIAAVNTYIDEETGSAVKPQATEPKLSLWKASGRQEIMQMSNLWQRRITPR